MNSPKYINYETRPAKFAERKMLLASFLKLCNQYGGGYQYIGLGGLTFTDFKLFHKELHIEEMLSIEGGNFTKEKLTYNCPYSFIQIIQSETSIALNNIDLTKKTLVWLDYDGTLDNYMFEDLFLLMNRLPIGSIYVMTCNRQLRNKDDNAYTINEFEEKFDNLVPFNLKKDDLSGSEGYKTIREMLITTITTTLAGRNKNGENIDFKQLYNIIYQENSGARMFTFGGIIVDAETPYSELNLDHFSFIRNDENAYKIEIPNITLKETDLINRYLANSEELEQLKNMNIISQSDIRKYKEVYKYLPYFFDVRI